MKAFLFALPALFILAHTALAQSNNYNVKPGEDLNTSLANNARFKYPAFTGGTVFFKDGTRSTGNLNYNFVNSEMQFIAPKGDTLALVNEADIVYIAIGSDTFFYDKGYLQLVASNATAKLAKKEDLRIADVKKEGGYGNISSTSAITTMSSVNVNGQAKGLTEQQLITLAKTTSYYIGDIYDHFLPFNKKNAIRMFGKNQSKIEQYCKDNKVSFTNEEDLKAFITFLNK